MSVTFRNYLISTLGLLLVALGIAMSILSNLGTTPLTCPAYVLSLHWSASVGEFTIIVNTILIAIQLLVLRRKFKLRYLMQIPASIVFGYMIDFWMWALGTIAPVTLLSRWALILGGCIITAAGVSLEVAAQAWMLSAEMTVYAFTTICSMPFRNIKIIIDCLHIVAAAALSYFLFGNPFGSGDLTSLKDVANANVSGTVIGIGTVVCAILPGLCMKWTDPLISRLLVRSKHGESDGKWKQAKKSQPISRK